jgi:hypothetical protein
MEEKDRAAAEVSRDLYRQPSTVTSFHHVYQRHAFQSHPLNAPDVDGGVTVTRMTPESQYVKGSQR